MLTVTVRCLARISSDDDLRLRQTDGSDDFANQHVPSPLGDRLGATRAIPEVVERAVPGLSTIDRTCSEALPRSIDAERVT